MTSQADIRRYRVSRFVHIFEKDDAAAIFHSLNLNILYVSPSILDILKILNKPFSIEGLEITEIGRSTPDQVFDSLVKAGMLVPDDFDEMDAVRELQRRSITEPHITELFLVPTDECNFHCRYCHVVNNRLPDHACQHMTTDTAIAAVEKFIELTADCHNEQKNIVFYGGETLINFPVIRDVIEYSAARSKAFAGPLKFTIFTNCSLVTEDIAGFLGRHRVSIIASIDGTEDMHDAMRVTAGGAATYQDVIAGYQRLKEAGCTVGISCTVGPHNLNALPDIVDHFVRNLRPANLGFNMQHHILGKSNPGFVPLETVNARMIEAYVNARKEGLYLVHAINRLRVIAERRPRLKDCPACSRQIVVAPDGDVGPCEVFVTTRNYYIREKAARPAEILRHDTFRQWHARSHFYWEDCHSCPAILLCGGGCPYDSHSTSGNINCRDERACVQSNAFLAWALWDIMDTTWERPLLPEGQFWAVAPTEFERRSVYGAIKSDGADTPLGSYHARAHL